MNLLLELVVDLDLGYKMRLRRNSKLLSVSLGINI